MKKSCWRTVGRTVVCLSPALLAAALFLGLRHAPFLAEYVFARGVFRVLSWPLDWLSSLYPWSLAELLLVLALPLLILLAVLAVRRLRRSAHRRKTAGRLGRAVLATLSSVLLLYMLMHGNNYYRTPLPELMGFSAVQDGSAAELQAICEELVRRANAVRETLPEDENGCMTLPESLSVTLRHADDCYRPLAETYGFLRGTLWRVKPVQLSYWWSYTGTTGVYFPLLGEANVNVAMPAWSIPATALHEVAHTRGFAREDECNFLMVLTGLSGDDPVYTYSAALMAYIYAGNALYRYDPARWEAVRAQCSDGVQRDLRQQNDYWEQFEGEVQEASSAVNNAFIQSQGVPEGVLSYDRVVALLAGWYRAKGQIAPSA